MTDTAEQDKSGDKAKYCQFGNVLCKEYASMKPSVVTFFKCGIDNAATYQEDDRDMAQPRIHFTLSLW